MGKPGKRKPTSILKRAAAQESERPGKKRKTQTGAAQGGNKDAPRPQQQERKGSGGSGARERRPQALPAGLRPVSAVHSQAAYAVRRLLQADASKQGGVTLKSLTLAPHITAKKVGSACPMRCPF